MIWTFLVLWWLASISFWAGARWRALRIKPFVWGMNEGKLFVSFYATVFRAARVDDMCRLPDVPPDGEIQIKIWQLIEGDVLPAGSTCHVEMTATDPSVILMGDFANSPRSLRTELTLPPDHHTHIVDEDFEGSGTLTHSSDYAVEGSRALKFEGDARYVSWPKQEGDFEAPWPIVDDRSDDDVR